MAIYMQISGIPGNATAKGYENWIQLSSLHHFATRSVHNEVGAAKNRGIGVPRLGEIEIVKNLDAATPLLFQRFCAGSSISTVKIDLVSTDEQLQPYLEYTLSNVIISSITNHATGGAPYSVITLNYTKIEEKFTAHDGSGVAQSPIVAGYNLETAEQI